MGYVGNEPSVNFTSFAKQDLTGVTGSPVKRGFTLTYAVANANEIEVFVNNVRQEPTEAYTVSGTALTMTGDVETTDDFYVIYLGKALQTTTPPDGSVTSAKLDTNIAIDGDLTVDTSTLKVDSTNNRVGIGQSSPNTLLHLKADDPTIFLEDNSPDDARGASIHSAAGDLFLRTGDNLDTGSPTVNSEIVLTNGNNIVFRNNASTERMRITSEGIIQAGNLNEKLGGGTNFMSLSGNGYPPLRVRRGADTGHCVLFYGSSGTSSSVGNITTSGSATSYNTSSDHRIKENVTADWDATTRLKQLNPVRFNFISDADTTVDGFLAHEVQSVVPEAISGTHNEVDADGNPVYQGIDQSKLVPLLVKTIQELEARITALENS